MEHRWGLPLWRGLAPALIVAALAATVQAEPEAIIYRCEHDGVIEFTDRPCGDDADNAERFVPGASSISVISAADDLEEIQRDNQAWLRDYRARQQAERAARSQGGWQGARNSRPPSRPAPAVTRTLVAPLFWNEPPKHHHPRPHPPGDIAPSMRRQRPFSALSGPFPGTRRSDRQPSVPDEADQ